MQVRRDYELLRMKYEHYLKTNEQTGEMNLYFLVQSFHVNIAVSFHIIVHFMSRTLLREMKFKK